MIRYSLVAFVAIICVAASSQAIDLIEMNDKNQAILLLPLAKPLKGVQSAYRNGFNFNSVKAVIKFLDECAYVNKVMSKSSDDAYEGLAKQIKLIMAEPTIASACSVTPNQIKECGIEALDDDFAVDNHDYLSGRKTEKLVTMKQTVARSPSLSTALGNFLNERINDLAEASLTGAVENINIFFGEHEEKAGFFDFNYMNYRSTCRIQKVKPICKLVRRSSDEDVTAISEDVADFVQIVLARDEAKLAKYQEASGVTLEDVKTQCASMKDSFGSFLRPISLIEKWIAGGLMPEEQFQQRLTVDRELAFYNQLYKLCELVH